MKPPRWSFHPTMKAYRCPQGHEWTLKSRCNCHKRCPTCRKYTRPHEALKVFHVNP